MTFLYACYHKIVAPAHFAKIIYGYYLLPDFAINLIAICLPFLELYCALALILGIYPRSAALILNGMLIGFIMAVSINLVRGHQFDCGCFAFGEPDHTSSAVQLLIRDLIYLTLGVHVLFYSRRRRWCIRQSGSILGNIRPIS